jgi:hypothetical protein
MTFGVGQKVVCVDARKRARIPSINYERPQLTKGAVYTIRELDGCDGYHAVRLVEIVEPILDIWIDRGPSEPAWHSGRFRPIVERKTSIAIFKAMLTPAGKKERANG